MGSLFLSFNACVHGFTVQSKPDPENLLLRAIRRNAYNNKNVHLLRVHARESGTDSVHRLVLMRGLHIQSCQTRAFYRL
jgi:hypothetical protein